MLLANRDVRFYEQVKCPLAFGFSSPSALREIAVAGVVGKWESRVVGGIPKRSVFSTALGRRFCFFALPTDPPPHLRSVLHTHPPLPPRHCGQYAGIIPTPSSRRPRPTCVIRCRSTISPACGVSQK